MSVRFESLIEVYERAYETPVKDGEAWRTIRNIPVQKDFAAAVKLLFLNTAPFFMVRAGKYPSFRAYFADLRINALADMLGLGEESDDGSRVD